MQQLVSPRATCSFLSFYFFGFCMHFLLLVPPASENSKLLECAFVVCSVGAHFRSRTRSCTEGAVSSAANPKTTCSVRPSRYIFFKAEGEAATDMERCSSRNDKEEFLLFFFKSPVNVFILKIKRVSSCLGSVPS